MEGLFYKDDPFFHNINFDQLTDDERSELARKVHAAQADPRYADPNRREKAYVDAINEAWSLLYPGKRSGV